MGSRADNEWVKKLWFMTSLRRYFSFGGNKGKEAECSTQGASKPYLLAIGAGIGENFRNIKFIYLDLAEHKGLAQLVDN